MPRATTVEPPPARAGRQTRESAVPGNRHAACAPCGALSYPWRSQEELGGRFLGHPAYPTAKAQGNQSMLGKRRLSEDVVGQGAARLACQGQCLIASRPISARRKCPPIGRTSDHRCCRVSWSERSTTATFARQAMANEAIQGDEWAAYSTLGRTTATYHGMAYGWRHLWSRSPDSSRGNDAPPRNEGKPRAGRSGIPRRRERAFFP